MKSTLMHSTYLQKINLFIKIKIT